MRKFGTVAVAVATGFVALAPASFAVAGERWIAAPRPGAAVCWNPPDAVRPGFVPCGPRTGLDSPRRVDGSFGVHPDEWFYNRPISPPGTMTGSSDVGTPPGWDQ